MADQPTVVVVNPSAPQPEPSSAPPPSDTTQSEETERAVQLGAALESNRQLMEQNQALQLRLDAQETEHRQLRSDLDSLTATLAEEETDGDTVAIVPTLEPTPQPAEPEEPPARQPTKWERMCDWINGM